MTYPLGLIVCCMCYIFYAFYLIYFAGLIKLLFTAFPPPNSYIFFVWKLYCKLHFPLGDFFFLKWESTMLAFNSVGLLLFCPRSWHGSDLYFPPRLFSHKWDFSVFLSPPLLLNLLGYAEMWEIFLLLDFIRISTLVGSCVSILFSLLIHSHIRSGTGTRMLTAAWLVKVNYKKQPSVRQ